METRARKKKSSSSKTAKTWIRPLDLSDTYSYNKLGPVVPERAVSVQLANGNKLDIWLEGNGSLHMVPVTSKTEIVVTRGADGDGFEVRVEKIR